MRRHLKNYRWDVLRGHFILKSMEPLAEAERETPELVEGLVEAIEDLYDKLGKKEPPGAGRSSADGEQVDLVMPERTRRVFEKFRRLVPRRQPQRIEISSEKREAALASLANNPPALPASEANDKGKNA